MSHRFEQPPQQSPIEAMAELEARTKRMRELAEFAITGATTPEEAEKALKEAEDIVPELEARRAAIREKLWPFTELTKESLTTQYKEEITALETSGVLIELQSGERGIKGIDGIEYPLPTIKEVVAGLKEAESNLNREKVEQNI